MQQTLTAPTNVASILENIEKIAPFIESSAAEGERQRNVLPEVVDALRDAGTFRASAPLKYGGVEAGVLDRFNISRAVARADGGAGWITAIILGNNWILGLYPQQAQDDVFGEDPEARVTAIIAIDGRADKVDGGYRVSGRWGYNSGLTYSSWVLVGVAVHDENGNFVDTAQIMLRREDVTEEDTWFVAGLKSTGSNTVIADNVLVPEHHALMHSPTVSGANVQDDDPSHRSAFVASLSLWLIGPQVGIAEAIFDRVLAKSLTKGIAYTTFESQSKSTAVQLRLAKARLAIDTAILFAEEAGRKLEEYASERRFPSVEVRAYVRAVTSWIADHLQDAVESLLYVHGSGAFAEVNPLQRMWRDISVASRHALILPDIGYELYGKALVGEPTEAVTPLV